MCVLTPKIELFIKCETFTLFKILQRIFLGEKKSNPLTNKYWFPLPHIFKLLKIIDLWD